VYLLVLKAPLHSLTTKTTLCPSSIEHITHTNEIFSASSPTVPATHLYEQEIRKISTILEAEVDLEDDLSLDTAVKEAKTIQDTGGPLPPGWFAVTDPSSGNTYYANPATGESSWDRPKVIAAPPPKVEEVEPPPPPPPADDDDEGPPPPPMPEVRITVRVNNLLGCMPLSFTLTPPLS
jgi:hypothetical protein